MSAATLIDRIHERCAYPRRTAVLAEVLSPLVPDAGLALDVGCGDGLIAKGIEKSKPGLSIVGVDVLIRAKTNIPVCRFDGHTLPFPDESFDSVLLVDVLHHTDSPAAVLREAARVSRNSIVLKDHNRGGSIDDATLRFMDWAGNARHGVPSPANYLSEAEWRIMFDRLSLRLEFWTGRVDLYPWWASWLFGRSLHFLAKLIKHRGYRADNQQSDTPAPDLDAGRSSGSSDSAP